MLREADINGDGSIRRSVLVPDRGMGGVVRERGVGWGRGVG